uniref:Predicted gene, ENSMUSG00000053531 n=1 Tax=Mus musculus TaxID=10090 RepID=Q8K1B6_MOUSE|nr:Predicted gene, ENSMUSG00000053531 [Mus musculus]
MGQKIKNTQAFYFHSPVNSKSCPIDTFLQPPFLTLVIDKLPSVATVGPTQDVNPQVNRLGLEQGSTYSQAYCLI